MAVLSIQCLAQPVIYVNQVGFDTHSPKIAVVALDAGDKVSQFHVVNTINSKIVFGGKLGKSQKIEEWIPGKLFCRADLSAFDTPGQYKLQVTAAGKNYWSAPFQIGDNLLAKLTIPAILHYYRNQRANTPAELEADSHLLLYGSDQRVDLHGGWCDASGDVSKYFSHLAYANYMSPQQTPLVTWSLINTAEKLPKLLSKLGVTDSIRDEAFWGADYMMRCLSKEDYFYMIVFSYFNKDPNARRVVGLHANSVTTNEYQCAFREGGGMAIAALARISQWKTHGEYTQAQYLDAAKRAFAHLLVNNTRYDDDGKENIIDDYCALMAATELWKATGNELYAAEARKRAGKLEQRLTPFGYFSANDAGRPYWHASDAGLPIVALLGYAEKESDGTLHQRAVNMIEQALNDNLAITGRVINPFGYARQTFSYKGTVKDGFFIPHDNETGWWWQGENARLGSLATAALTGRKVANDVKRGALSAFAYNQLNWILGCNPYNMCFMYGFGVNNVPYMSSNFGHGSQRGGISNGITGKEGNGEGRGIDFKTSAQGNEWRWTEQWIPHAAWFLQAVTAMAEHDGN
ncbi:glycosyl transferase [Mucilaginibacter sp. PPCGB 2223]|nr:glycosyl transferase [Mucilaginibacter sp. PPCGB 2223]